MSPRYDMAPPLFDWLVALGRKRTLARLDRAIEMPEGMEVPG